MDRDPAGVVILVNIFLVGLLVIHWSLATFSLSKIWIFKKIPVIGKRLTDRQERKELEKKFEYFQIFIYFRKRLASLSSENDMR